MAMVPVDSAAREAVESKGEEVYGRVYHVLVAGMFSSTALFALGLLRALLSHETVPLTRRWVQAQYDWSIFWDGLLHFQATSLLMLATFLLILTPVLRVLVSIYAFALEGNGRYVVVTSIVFGVICLTLVLAKLGVVSGGEGVRPATPAPALAHAPAAHAPLARDPLANAPAP